MILAEKTTTQTTPVALPKVLTTKQEAQTMFNQPRKEDLVTFTQEKYDTAKTNYKAGDWSEIGFATSLILAGGVKSGTQ